MTYDFGLESIDLTRTGQTLETDVTLALPVSPGTEPLLCAIGDVNDLIATSHTGFYQVRIVSNAILSRILDKQPSATINPPPSELRRRK